MIGIDTNVLIRVFLNDDDDQFRAVRTLLRDRGGETFLIVPLVIAEFVLVMHRHLGRPLDVVVELVERILEAPEFVVVDADRVAEALAVYRAGGTDFSDCLIVAAARAAGADGVLTFDRDAARRIPGAKLIET